MTRIARTKRSVVQTETSVRRCGAGTWCGAMIASALLLVACGGGKPKPAAEPEAETTAAGHESDTKSDTSPEPSESASASAGEQEAAPAETAAPAEAPCKFDNSKPIENSMGTMHITGCIDPAKVVDSLQYKWRSVFDCYQDARKADAKAKGTVKIIIGVGKKGVRSVQIPTSEIPSDTFIQCVIDTLRDAPMTKPEQDTATIVWTAKF